jgi:hypothetical protein
MTGVTLSTGKFREPQWFVSGVSIDEDERNEGSFGAVRAGTVVGSSAIGSWPEFVLLKNPL